MPCEGTKVRIYAFRLFLRRQTPFIYWMKINFVGRRVAAYPTKNASGSVRRTMLVLYKYVYASTELRKAFFIAKAGSICFISVLLMIPRCPFDYQGDYLPHPARPYENTQEKIIACHVKFDFSNFYLVYEGGIVFNEMPSSLFITIEREH